MCGIFGIYGHPEAANLTYLGLHALQHRGQESAGITCRTKDVSGDDMPRFVSHHGLGRVANVFTPESIERLSGDAAIGHVRYSTSNGTGIRAAQPFSVRHGRGWLGLVHNGNLSNAHQLRRELERAGSIFSTLSDTEVIIHLYARQEEEVVEDRVKSLLERINGAYAIALMTGQRLIALRDPHGFRPLEVGRLIHVCPRSGEEKTAWIVSSETSAFDLVGATYEKSLAPGEGIVIDDHGARFVNFAPKKKIAFCAFEQIYFARPDSVLGGKSVYESRVALGRQLATEAPADADIVIPVPDSGTAAALGFAEAAGIRFEMGLIRSHYIGRTFIEPSQSIRNFGVRLKLAPVKSIIQGKRVCIVDDSLVRGTTSRKIVEMLSSAGAKEVHLRISSPPITHSCYYGIDTPNRDELIAANNTVEDIRAFIGCTSLSFLSLAGMNEAIRGHIGKESLCNSCFTGEYPTIVESEQQFDL